MSEWTRPAQPVRCVVELDKPLVVRRERGVLAQGDAEANAVVAEVYSTAGKPYDLSGCTVLLTFVRPDNNALPPVTAEISGNVATATLPDGAYELSGMYSMRMQLRKNGAERTIVWIVGEVKGTDVDGIADPEHVISIENVMASAKEAQNAASAANTAAARANAGAERAEQLQIDASGLAGDSNMLAGKPPSYYLLAEELLDNPDFAIAQAGYPVWDATNKTWISGLHGSELYAADRWIASFLDSTFSRNGTVNHFETKTDGYAFISQRLFDDGREKGKAYTFAIVLADGTVKVANGTFPSADVSTQTIVGSAHVKDGCVLYMLKEASGHVRVRIDLTKAGASVDFLCVRLIPGAYTADTLPPYVQPDPTLELAKCQRACVVPTDARNVAHVAMNGALYITIPIPGLMYKTPSLGLNKNGSLQIYNNSGTWVTLDLISIVVYMSTTFVTLQGFFNDIGLSNDNTYLVQNLPMLIADL